MIRGVVVAAIAFEARCCLSRMSIYACHCVACLQWSLRTLTGCSMNLRQGQAGDIREALKLQRPRGGLYSMADHTLFLGVWPAILGF